VEPLKIVLDGAKFSNMEEFFAEMERLLTKDPDGRPGRSLDAFNDLLRGGFGVHAYGQGLEIQWVRSEKSRQDLGYPETALYWERALKRCHPSNQKTIQNRIEAARRGEGKTLFDLIVDIIQDEDHSCTLSLDGKGCRSIAIDGPAGAGKSTLARQLAQKLGFLYVDTGAIYRTVAVAVLRAGADPADPSQVIPLLERINIQMGYAADGVQRMELNGEDVTQAIRENRVSGAASRVAAIPEVRARLLDYQRTLSRTHDIVMDGRDIGTVVLPGADVKIFLTASPEVRARRRTRELEQRGEPADFESILREIRQRDEQDRSRSVSPLRQAEDAVLVDTSDLDLDQSLQVLLQTAKEGLEK